MDEQAEPAVAIRPFKQRLAIVITVFAVTACGLLLRIPWDGRVATATFDLMHGPVFFCVCFILLWLVPPTDQARHVMMRANLAVGLAIFSGVVEYTQQFVGRNTSRGDLIANCLGVIAGWLFFEWIVRRKHRLGRIALGAAVIVLFAAVTPAITELIDCAREQIEFPLLDSFEHGKLRWKQNEASIKVVHAPELASDGSHVLQWNLQVAEYPGCQIYEPYKDWSGFKRLELEMTLADDSPKGELAIYVKVQDRLTRQTPFKDRYKDRFQQRFVLARGKRRPISIKLADIESGPSSRTMDMTRIDLLEFFAIEPDTEMKVFIDHVRLTK